jgi:HAD superfamily hydrolase (TIGR01509 family)
VDNIRAVIFDLGRVLVDFDHRISAEKISFLAGKDSKEVYDLFFNSPLIQSFEEGKVSPKEFFAEVKKRLEIEISFEEFLPVWNDIFFLTDENRSVCQLSRHLKKYYKVALLSNVNILHFEHLKNNFPLFDAFGHIFTSYEIGFIKPDPRIYQKAIDSLKCLPQEIFYTDDREELINAAKNIGLRSFVYKGIEQLKQDLASCGITYEKR